MLIRCVSLMCLYHLQRLAIKHDMPSIILLSVHDRRLCASDSPIASFGIRSCVCSGFAWENAQCWSGIHGLDTLDIPLRNDHRSTIVSLSYTSLSTPYPLHGPSGKARGSLPLGLSPIYPLFPLYIRTYTHAYRHT